MSKEKHFLDKHNITNSLIHELSELLKKSFYKKFDRIYESALADFQKYGGRGPLEIFQRNLEHINRWKKERKIKEYKILLKKNRINKEYLNKLIDSVHKAYVNEYVHTLGMNSAPTVRIKVPNGVTFIWKCYENIARELWRKAYLFSRQVTAINRQQNINAILNSIDSSILRTIRDAVPLREIEHISKYASQGDNSEEHKNEDQLYYLNQSSEEPGPPKSSQSSEEPPKSSQSSEEPGQSKSSEEGHQSSEEQDNKGSSSDNPDDEINVMQQMASILGMPINFGEQQHNWVSNSKIEEVTGDSEENDPIDIGSDSEEEVPVVIADETKEVKEETGGADISDKDAELFQKFMKFQQFMSSQG